MRNQCLIFDVDGTLLDTTEGVLEGMETMISEMGLPSQDRQKLVRLIGPPIKGSFRDVFHLEGERLDKAVKCFRDFYGGEGKYKAAPYDGVEEMCESLSDMGVYLAVASYKPDVYVKELLRYFKLDHYFRSVHGADMEGKLKKADLIRQCAVELQADDRHSAYVGDTEGDYMAAVEAGMPFIAVTYGFGFRREEDIVMEHMIGMVSTPAGILDIYNREIR